MKRCPFCGAEIAENARFCLYCMARLTEATPVQTSSKRKNARWWGLLAAVFVLCAVLWGALGTDRARDTDDGTVAVTTTLPTTTTSRMKSTVTTTTATPTTATTATDTSASETTTVHVTTDTERSTTTTETTTSASRSTATTATTTSGMTTTAATATTTSVTTTTAATTTTRTTTTTVRTTTTTARTTTTTVRTTTAGTTTTAFTQPTAPPPSGTPRVYWRAATAADGNGLPQHAAVITGFEYLPQGGVLCVPATVEGQIVVGIDMRQAQGMAFDVPSVCARITVLYLPPSIHRVPDDLFVHFTNLTDLYIGSDDFYMPPSALPPVSARAGKLTLHTPSGGRCAFADDAFAACCFSLYAASHRTWEPTAVYEEGTV